MLQWGKSKVDMFNDLLSGGDPSLVAMEYEGQSYTCNMMSRSS